MPESPLKPIEDLDPALYHAIEDNRQLSLGEGALPAKYKTLIAMVLDAVQGAETGVRSLAQAAMQAGATKEEVAEALRVAYFINGVSCMYTAARGLYGLF